MVDEIDMNEQSTERMYYILGNGYTTVPTKNHHYWGDLIGTDHDGE